MASERLFLDTGFVVALFNEHDQHHAPAMDLTRRFAESRELWTTEAVLLEVGAAFREPSLRSIAVDLWAQLRSDRRCKVVSISGGLLERAMELFGSRMDKAWSLTDCASFVVMRDQQLTDALTCDHHFVQAGFRALRLEEREGW